MSTQASILNPARQAAEEDGFQVHEGKAEDGDLSGRHWWSLTRPEWTGVEVSEGDFATADEAWSDAIKQRRVELMCVIPFAS